MKVKIYSATGCPHCKQAKDYLKKNNITFEEINMSENKDKVKELQEISGMMSTPTLDIGGKIIVGFDQEKIRQALNL
ncbi:MAG: glutaredoxin family protein [Nitrospirota bacterium]